MIDTEQDIEPTQADMIRASEAFVRLLRWVYSGYGNQRFTMRSNRCVARLFCVAWMVDPHIFDNATEAEVARRAGILPRHMSEAVQSFKQEFKFETNRGYRKQKH